ncbi:indoleamine 2,3-dioxygenase family protein [Coccidioides immitis H538.4]|nr:indoleamine 2,3-dioxygenase family protein [Coccidioides immitis H538.4]
MVKESYALISGAVRILNSLDTVKDRKEINDAYRQILTAMTKIEECMEDMWKNSKPTEYLAFRVFIFGITSQSMFPNGVVYEGINDNKPLYFRGESGANDSIIPLLDHLLEIPMPDTPLTKILHEFRAYRPLPHREFLTHVRLRSKQLGVREFSIQDPETVLLYLKTLDHVRSFRWRHWLFAREYIIKRTPHPTATGGSPIVTWLPNQLSAVMDLMISTYDEYVAPMISKEAGTNGASSSAANGEADLGSTKHYRDQVQEVMETVRDQRIKLAKEVERWCAERGV